MQKENNRWLLKPVEYALVISRLHIIITQIESFFFVASMDESFVMFDV